MVLLFELTLSKPVKGFSATVGAQPSGLVGVYRQGVPYEPDRAAIRAALPHYYRAAFDRNKGSFWFERDREECNAYLTLYDRRGKHLNTIYANAYDYPA